MVLTHLRKLAVLACLVCCVLSSSAQLDTIHVSGEFENTTLHLAIRKIAADKNIDFAYDVALLEGIKVDTKFEDLPLHLVLDELLKDHDLTYQQIGETIVIFQRDSDEILAVEPTEYDITISGRIEDAENGERLPYATLRVLPGQKHGISNVDGYFTLYNVPNDTALISVSYLGYRSKLIRLRPDMDLMSLEIDLSQNESLLPSAEVYGEQQKAMEINREVSVISLNADIINQTPNIGEPDLYKSIQLLPGVTGTLENSGGLNIRGGKSDENLILYDGFTIYHQDHFYGIFSAFNPMGIKNIRLHKGAYDVKYGGRSSGVLEIEGKDGNIRKPSIQLGMNLISTNFLLETPIVKNKLTLMVAGRRAFTDVVQSDTYRRLFNNLYNSKITPPNQKSVDIFDSEGSPDFTFYDLTAKLSYKPNARDHVSLSMYSGADQLKLSYEEDLTENFLISFNDRSNWGNTGFSASWSRKWNEKYYTQFIAGYSEYNNELTATDLYVTLSEQVVDTNFYSHENEFRDISFQWNNEYSVPGHQITFGANLNYNDLDYTFGTVANTGTLDDKGIQLAGYLQDKWKITDKTTVRPGVRLTYYDVTEQIYFEPRMAVYHELGKDIRLKAAAGVHYQMVKRVLQQDIYLNTPDLWRLSNDTTIPVSLSNHFIAGAIWEFGQFALDVELYYKTIFGTEQELPFVDAGVNAGQNFVFGEGEIYGLDLILQKKTGRYTGWIAYTLSKARNQFTDIAGGEVIPSSLDQTHEIKWVNLYNWRKWEFSGVFTLASGRPYTPLLGTYSLQTPSSVISNFVVFGEINSGRLPEFHRLDISAAYNFTIGKGKAAVGATVYNVYDRINVKGKRYFAVPDPDDELEIQAGERDIPTLGILPTVFFNIQF